MRILDFSGILYAVHRLDAHFSAPYELIPEGWKKLVTWKEDGVYKTGNHQWLEEHLRTEKTPPGEWSLDLHLPVVE